MHLRSTLYALMYGRIYSITSSVLLPLDTYAHINPAALASLKMPTAHSLVISGSLYEDTTAEAPVRCASSTMPFGVMRRTLPMERSDAGSRSAWEVTQFWQ